MTREAAETRLREALPGIADKDVLALLELAEAMVIAKTPATLDHAVEVLIRVLRGGR